MQLTLDARIILLLFFDHPHHGGHIDINDNDISLAYL